MMDFVANHPMPGIPVDPKNIKILHTPQEFYSTLLERIRTAEKRIVLSSLYLGDGKLERDLVDELNDKIDNTKKLDVRILLDYLRGTRGESNERSSTTILRKIAHKAKVYLYHTPELNGFFKRCLPERTNEIIGLQHMKLYIFDNSIIISGANLSDSYFTNRQDRYIIFENSPEITNFFCDIVQAVGSSSFVLNEDGTIDIHEKCDVHPYLGDTETYKKMLALRVNNVISEYQKEFAGKFNEEETMVYPVIQMGNIGINQEFELVKKVLAQKGTDWHITMASGYFNCIEDYEKVMFEEANYTLDIITASPKSNGFFGARGPSKYIPALYSEFASKFLDRRREAMKDNIYLFEYNRKGWTFHAKGLWILRRGFAATLVGSSNFGYRSVHRDLEAQLLLVTKSEELFRRLSFEKRRLHDHSLLLEPSLTKPEHHVPALVRVVSKFIRNFL
ncbi:unnamed protein product [Caenorhabditis bovis]|uniref:CDP-diacylglycerol--glycerol-3-phosphate 3-phosphatidyltransferase n=1 Tax=Caenorhabditis bovis TaxID=2654633 RepID=A0A8S1E9P2_9PELO|nr:unnamed protein product [Caenorhabditis bovis]